MLGNFVSGLGTQAALVALPYQVYVQTESALLTGLLGAVELGPLVAMALLGVLREADGTAVGLRALAEAGIDDPANAIFELERAGHCIEREYAEVSAGRRRLLGYRLRRARTVR